MPMTRRSSSCSCFTRSARSWSAYLLRRACRRRMLAYSVSGRSIMAASASLASAPKIVPPRRSTAHLRTPLRLPAATISVVSLSLTSFASRSKWSSRSGGGRRRLLGAEDVQRLERSQQPLDRVAVVGCRTRPRRRRRPEVVLAKLVTPVLRLVVVGVAGAVDHVLHLEDLGRPARACCP